MMDAMNKGLTYELTYRDVVDIMKIIDESACRELHLEIGDFKLDLVKGPPGADAPFQGNAGAGGKIPGPGQAAAIPTAAAQTTAAAAVKNADLPPAAVTPRRATADGSVEIITPLAGVFYRASAPGAPPFVEAGSKVEAGDQVAIVEVMKLMNSIKAPRKGVIREILIPNETLVTMGQVLMILEPAPALAEK